MKTIAELNGEAANQEFAAAILGKEAGVSVSGSKVRRARTWKQIMARSERTAISLGVASIVGSYAHFSNEKSSRAISGCPESLLNIFG